MPEISEILTTLSLWALPVLLAITLHEAGHAFVAWKLGDDTAYRQGRVTLNPIAHVDPMGTIVIPLVLLSLGGLMFGYAKPVPVVGSRLRKPKRDMIWVALAGPGMNMVVALGFALTYHLAAFAPEFLQEWMQRTAAIGIWFNCLIAVFNMLPIPPLDGGRVVTGLLPLPLAIKFARLERYGFFIIIGGILILPMIGRSLGLPLDVFHVLVRVPTEFLFNLVATVTGLG